MEYVEEVSLKEKDLTKSEYRVSLTAFKNRSSLTVSANITASHEQNLRNVDHLVKLRPGSLVNQNRNVIKCTKKVSVTKYSHAS
jgi:hypothetical protein